MGKYQSVMAEAAHTVALHGFAEEFGDVAEPGGWNGLADLSATVLLNLGEDDVRSRFIAEHGDDVAGFLVWIREDENGFVTVVERGSDGGLRSGTDAVGQAFDAAREAAEAA